VGLGADLVRPVSWVFDEQGIYFDRHAPSTLESLLQDGDVGAADLVRAAALRERIVANGLTKYNLAADPWRAPEGKARVVLVPGQVETDASIQAGAVDIRTNAGLLQAVRQARPDAWIVYKPHPDVVAGLRQRGPDERAAMDWCNEVVTAGSLHQMLDEVDEVHVLTSLAGFEALLRHKPVACWGQPFYAGWGLTQDSHPHPRRTRRLTLDDLVAAALIHYPVYVNPETGQRCQAEEALDVLVRWRDRAPRRLPWWRRALRPLLARP
jgi:capsular polysaccharide export protein